MCELSSIDTPGSDDPKAPNAAAQVVAIILATGLSLIYFILTRPYVEGLPKLDWTPILVQSILGLIVAGMSFGLSPAVESSKDFVNNTLSISPRAAQAASISGLFVVSAQCIFLLGYLTQETGGTFYSPYVQPLLAMALLSPVVAKTKDTVILVAVLVVCVYAFFGDWAGDGPPDGVTIPLWVYFFTPVVALVIGLLNPLLGRSREVPLMWRRERKKWMA